MFLLCFAHLARLEALIVFWKHVFFCNMRALNVSFQINKQNQTFQWFQEGLCEKMITFLSCSWHGLQLLPFKTAILHLYKQKHKKMRNGQHLLFAYQKWAPDLPSISVGNLCSGRTVLHALSGKLDGHMQNYIYTSNLPWREDKHSLWNIKMFSPLWKVFLW